MTYTSDAYPCCGGLNLESRTAIVSPFLSAYVFNAAPEPCHILRCRACELKFYDERLTAIELANLYTNYRGPKYFSVRNALEPWYTTRYNKFMSSEGEMSRRRAFFHGLLQPWLPPQGIASVLDFGGDNGGLISQGPRQSRYVYDVSGADSVPGVERLASERELDGREFDLVTLCHVLEHLPEPLNETKRVAQHVAPGGLLYVELPFEPFSLRQIPQGAWYRAYVSWLCRRRVLLRLVDFWSTSLRVKCGRVAPFGFMKLHEHINYFDETSLRYLLTAAGLEILYCETSKHLKTVVAVCRRPAVALRLARTSRGCALDGAH